MPSRPHVLGASVLVVGALVSILAAQEQPPGPQQPTTFRGGIQTIRVDLYATQDGKPVTDLRRDEIQIVEDGTPQAIETFEQISFAAPARAAARPSPRDESPGALTDPRARLFVVFVPGRTASPTASVLTQLRVPLIQHVNGLLGPDDLVAVMTPETRIDDLKFYRRLPADTRTWFDELPDDPRHTLWDICYPSYVPGSPNAEMKARLRELLTFEALDALIAYLGGVREERKHVLMLSDGFRQYYRNPKLGAGVIDEGRNQAGPSGVTQRPGDTTASVSPRQCEADLADLGSLEHASRLDEIGAHARRNNVAFYPIYPSGINPPNSNRGRGFGGGNFKNRSPSERQSALRDLAEDTGGVPILNTKDIEGHLDKVMTATSAYYLIGYSPTNTTIDGRYRRITVKVSRPGIQVRARQGYVALPPLEARALPLIDTSRAPVPIEVAMGPLAVARSTAVNVRATSWTRSTGSGAPTSSLWVVAEVEPQFRPRSTTPATAELTLRPVRGGQTISRRIEVGADGSLVFDLRDDPTLAVGDYSMQLALTGGSAEPVGEFGRLSISSAQSPLGEAVLMRRGAAAAQRYMRTADLRFQRTDRLRLELPTDAGGTPSAVLRDRRGAALPVPVQVNDRPDESGAFRWIVVDVPLISLAPADYAVEVTLAGASRMTAFRLTP